MLSRASEAPFSGARGVGALFTIGTHMDASKEVGGRKMGAVEKETGTLRNDYADSHTPFVHIYYGDTNDHRRTIVMNDQSGRKKRNEGSLDIHYTLPD